VKRPLSVLIIAGPEMDLEPVQRELARLGYAARYTSVQPGAAAATTVTGADWDLVICAGAGCWDLPSAMLERAQAAPPLIYLADAFALAQAFPSSLYVETVDRTLSGFDAAVRRALLFSAERRRRHERESEAVLAQHLHTAVAVSVDEGVLVQDGAGRATFLNPAAERILGWVSFEVAGRAVHDLLHRHSAAPAGVRDDCPLLAAQRSGVPTEVADDEFFRRDGTAFPAAYRVAPVKESGDSQAAVIAFRDLSDRRRLEDELLQRTYRDPLTGLPNAALFRERLSQALLRTDPSAGNIAVMFLDIDRFHVVNDGLGHTLGDLLLVDIGRRLAALLPPGTALARFGGDQFTILLEEVGRVGDATAIAELLIEELRAPFVLNGREVFITACIGIAISHPAAARPGDLLRDADAALHMAKAAGRARLAVFDRERDAPSVNRLDLETDLWRALQREELEVHYQPTVDLQTGAIAGFEALSRWRHPHLGLVSPAEFIPLAEEMGLMIAIGRWVLEEASRQTRQWHAQVGAGRRPSVSVNLSAKEFQHPDLPRQVAGALRRTGLAPHWLTLEITEGILMEDAPGTLKTLRALKKLGVQLAIDDFGTGYSSLSYLRRFPVDVVKIDRSLVQPLRNDRRSTAIVRAVTALAHDLGMAVTAEGIETPLQLTCLREVQADLGQGYIFSPAVTTERMTELLCAGTIEADPSIRTA
jgi:diguanylate cyclase (GGDEF)-like protein/PAS domain S-box-containing protein